MRRKLMMLAILLAGAGALGLEKPASAFIYCGWQACAGGSTAPCVCPPNTPAYGMTTECPYWRADCYYM